MSYGPQPPQQVPPGVQGLGCLVGAGAFLLILGISPVLAILGVIIGGVGTVAVLIGKAIK